MTVVCRSLAAPPCALPTDGRRHRKKPEEKVGAEEEEEEEVHGGANAGDGGFNIWSSIQSHSVATTMVAVPPPYKHPMERSASSFLSQRSLNVCTESLCSETGSDDFSDDLDFFSSSSGGTTPGSDYEPPQLRSAEDELIVETEQIELVGEAEPVEEEEEEEEEEEGEGEEEETEKRELVAVNYPCGTSRRTPERPLPPPLPSISRKDGQCISLRSIRKNGRLVVVAVPFSCKTFLHAIRREGRLIMSLVNATTTYKEGSRSDKAPAVSESKDEMMTEPMKKQSKQSCFVAGATPLFSEKPPSSTGKVVAAAARRRKEEVLQEVRRCGQLRRPPLFIWEMISAMNNRGWNRVITASA